MDRNNVVQAQGEFIALVHPVPLLIEKHLVCGPRKYPGTFKM